MAKNTPAPPLIVIYGDEGHQKETALANFLDTLLPPEVDRALALNSYDASEKENQGGPTITAVLEDLTTLPFLADCRVVVIREADTFITAHRERLEKYVAAPAPTGVLILECRGFPKTTRLYKAALAAGAQLRECKKLYGRALVAYVLAETRQRDKSIAPTAASRLVDLVGQDTGMLASEVEKLCLYIGERSAITDQDVSDLVGQSREEKIFAVADAAAAGRLPEALRLWHQVLETDPGAAFRAVGGLAYVVRRWLAAHRMLAAGENIRAIAPKMMMWGRERELQTLLRHQPPPRLRQALAAIAHLDSQAKSGARSIERGVEHLLVRLAAAAR
ncbi:MAG: DNA polymerase III subunit delta [Phycisphaerae bacterium]|nr:DNA polymerase III subunit delta [Phycisphaerae bacterium]